jgi:drug/metabolite transporter (DMT)-like permease
MEAQLAGVLAGLASGVVWGAGDFCGGLGTRRASVLGVLFVAEASGLVLLLAAAILVGEPFPSVPVLSWAIAAGLTGTAGLGALYRGLAIGRASVVAPVSAVVGALIPALYSSITIGLPDAFQLAGFGVAIVAIILASLSGHTGVEARALALGVVAGLGFGSFFILIDLSGSDSTFVPLAIARGVSIPFVLALNLVLGHPLPGRNVLPVVVLSGLLDAGGNVLFLLSSQLGRLDVATILASLYPASTVVLSRIVLGERVTRLQKVGVAAALVSIVLIAL